MDRFLEYIERYKFAILGTVLIHVIFFITSNMVTLKSPYQSQFDNGQDEPTEIELESDEIELDPELLEMLNQQNQQNNSQLYNLAADQNDRREKSYQNYSTQELEKQVMEEARALEQQYFDEWAKTHEGSEGEQGSAPEKDPSGTTPSEVKPKTDKGTGNEFSKSGDKAFAGQVMVSFNLKDRKAHSLKIPGYTCNGSGTIVIDIKVDKSGEVKSATLNPGLSQNATECMIEKSIKYAKMARFNFDESSTGLASGTITYKFQGQ